MSKAIDLQMHSHYSDGSKSPTELVEVLRSRKIVVASLTDHNTIHGQYEFQAAAKKYRIKTIPGVEIYATYKSRQFHILGYGIDINSAEMHDRLRETQVRRKKQIERMVPRLKKIGLALNISELFAQPATYIGLANVIRQIEKIPKNRALIRRALKKRHYDFYEILNKFFGRKAPCYMPEIALPITEVLGLIRRSGGTSVIAHPGWQLTFHEDYLIRELKQLGLQGIECFNSHHNWNQTAHYMNIARQNNMIITAGTDYHGDLPGDNIVDNYHGYTSLPYEIYEKIKLF